MLQEHFVRPYMRSIRIIKEENDGSIRSNSYSNRNGRNYHLKSHQVMNYLLKSKPHSGLNSAGSSLLYRFYSGLRIYI